MRFVTFVQSYSHASNPTQHKTGLHVGSMGDGQIILLGQGFESLGQSPALANSILNIIENQAQTLSFCRMLLEKFETKKLDPALVVSEKSVKLISPIPRPVSMRDGYAFRQHVEAARRNRGVPMIEEFDHFPVFYFTNHLAVVGGGELSVQKLAREKLDFELEGAIVLGKGGINIPANKADEHIFGYMIMNDWSARALQMEEMKLNLGPAKGKDFATGLGPYLITRDELAPYVIASPQGERHNLKMRAWVNKKQVSEGNLKDMTWTFAQIIERMSYGVQLHPGEVVGSGTVGTGCFMELNGSKITDNQWLGSGDEVVLEIDHLGRLENTIKAAD